jgi:hypothetical protein
LKRNSQYLAPLPDPQTATGEENFDGKRYDMAASQAARFETQHPYF